MALFQIHRGEENITSSPINMWLIMCDFFKVLIENHSYHTCVEASHNIVIFSKWIGEEKLRVQILGNNMSMLEELSFTPCIKNMSNWFILIFVRSIKMSNILFGNVFGLVYMLYEGFISIHQLYNSTQWSGHLNQESI